jgi:hypothetical protein
MTVSESRPICPSPASWWRRACRPHRAKTPQRAGSGTPKFERQPVSVPGRGSASVAPSEAAPGSSTGIEPTAKKTSSSSGAGRDRRTRGTPVRPSVWVRRMRTRFPCRNRVGSGGPRQGRRQHRRDRRPGARCDRATFPPIAELRPRGLNPCSAVRLASFLASFSACFEQAFYCETRTNTLTRG